MERPRDRRLQGLLLSIGVAVILASLLLAPSDDPRTLSLFGHELHSSCTLRAALGIPCWACGMTRSFAYGVRLRLAEAWAFSPAGLLLFLYGAAQVPYRLLLLLRPRTSRIPLLAQLGVLAAILVIMTGVWFARLGGHLPLP